MEKTTQKIFKNAFVANLREDLGAGSSLANYYSEDFNVPDDQEWDTTIQVDRSKLNLSLVTAGHQADLDLVNAIAVYEALDTLTEVQASDPRLWIHLTHVELRKYVLTRWPMRNTMETVAADSRVKQTAISYVDEHWFVGGTSRSLRRNAIARLWWAVHLTVSPWERDPEYFAELQNKDDPYAYTRVLFASQDIFQQVLERNIGRYNRLLVTVLHCIKQQLDADNIPSRNQVRSLMKELNLLSSVKNLSALSLNELIDLCNSILATTMTQAPATVVTE